MPPILADHHNPNRQPVDEGCIWQPAQSVKETASPSVSAKNVRSFPVMRASS